MSGRFPVQRSAVLCGLCALVVLATATGVNRASAAESLPVDPATGLVEGEGWALVAAHCGSCHSTKLVAQNRGSRARWLSLIRWMQESQGLWTFEAETEDRILDYLETHYGPLKTSRRQPLPTHLMPPNPHDDH